MGVELDAVVGQRTNIRNHGRGESVRAVSSTISAFVDQKHDVWTNAIWTIRTGRNGTFRWWWSGLRSRRDGSRNTRAHGIKRANSRVLVTFTDNIFHSIADKNSHATTISPHGIVAIETSEISAENTVSMADFLLQRH